MFRISLDVAVVFLPERASFSTACSLVDFVSYGKVNNFAYKNLKNWLFFALFSSLHSKKNEGRMKGERSIKTDFQRFFLLP